METTKRQSQNLQKVALTIDENVNEKLMTAPKRTILRRNRNRQHSNRFWQDLRDAPYR
jgi:hypothetical protein